MDSSRRSRAVTNSRRTAASSTRSSRATTPSQRSESLSRRPDLTWPTVCVANNRPPPGLSRIDPAISSWPRAQATILSPGCVSSAFGRSTSTGLFSAKRVQRLAREPVHGPLRVRPGAQALVETDRLPIPVEHRPFQATTPALDGELCEVGQERAPDAAPAVVGKHEQVLEVEPGAGEEGREGMEEQREADRLPPPPPGPRPPALG